MSKYCTALKAQSIASNFQFFPRNIVLAHVLCELGTFCTVLLSIIYSATCLPILFTFNRHK